MNKASSEPASTSCLSYVPAQSFAASPEEQVGARSKVPGGNQREQAFQCSIFLDFACFGWEGLKAAFLFDTLEVNAVMVRYLDA